MKTPRRNRRRGGSALEMAFLLPWYIFLYIGAFDWGYYSRALISTENAARTAAMYTSQNAEYTAVTSWNTTAVCNYALEELRVTPNISSTQGCTALPVITSYGPVIGADGQPATEVSVTYQTINLIPIPGILRSQATFVCRVQMRLRG